MTLARIIDFTRIIFFLKKKERVTDTWAQVCGSGPQDGLRAWWTGRMEQCSFATQAIMGLGMLRLRTRGDKEEVLNAGEGLRDLPWIEGTES